MWTLANGRVEPLTDGDPGVSTVLVPSEHVLLMTVDLPLPNRRARLAALPFAVEDRLADPVGKLHLALGSELGARRHLAGAVRHSLMADWVARLSDLPHARLVPDCLALPVPDAGGWTVQARDGRALVRTADAAGFAAPLASLPALWAAAGRPAVTSLGDPLPPELPAVDAEVELEPLTDRLLVPDLDLRQGPYAAPSRRMNPVFLKVAAVLALATLAHAVVAIADTLALQGIAEDRRAEAQALVQQYAPGTPLTPAYAAEVGALLATGGQRPRSAFFPLATRALPAAGVGGVGGFAWSEGAGLTLDLQGRDPVALQRAQGQLAATGLPVTAGGAPTQLVIRPGG